MRDVADEATKGREPARSLAIQDDSADRFADVVPYDPDRLVQVRILRQYHRHIEKVAPGVMDEICREVHVGALFFRVPDFDMRGRSSRRIYQWPHLPLGQESPFMDRHTWEGSQSLKITLLAYRGSRIEFSAYRRGEVEDAMNLIVEIEKSFGQSFQVQPLEFCLSKCAVVEVETVNVDVGPLHKSA